MSDLHPTPTRLALLRDVAGGSVRREYNTEPQTEHDYNTWAGRRVCARVAEAKAAGWVELDGTKFSTGVHGFLVSYWRLTEAGRSVLDAHGGWSWS